MALDATQVRVGITGAFYKAPLGTTAPTDAVTALDAAFEDLGYLSEDGIGFDPSESVENIIAWQNASNVRSTLTESVLGIDLTLLETNKATLEAYFRGSTVTSPGAGAFQLDVKPVVADPSAWVLDVVDGLKLVRIYVGNGEIVQRGQVKYANDDAVMWPISLRFYPDSNGNLMQKFSNDDAWDPA